jgi:hypothetical protein
MVVDNRFLELWCQRDAAADLVHGGTEITQPGATCRRLVTHYCPARNTPHYFRFIPGARRRKIPVEINRLVSTFYYDLAAPSIYVAWHSPQIGMHE